MNKWLSVVLAAVTLNANAHATTAQEYEQLFKGYDACYILYNVNKNKVVSQYNPNHRCEKRLAPNSSFKIVLSLMGFNEGLFNQDTVFKWDGKTRELPNWNQDQTPHSWMTHSALWVSQEVSPQLGLPTIKRYLAAFKYGNQDFSGDPGLNNGITHAWLSSSLKISANEQLHFLKALLKNQLPLTAETVANTKQNIYLGKLDNGANYYGKTGSGRSGLNERISTEQGLREGWFVGFVEQDNQQYIFISNLTEKSMNVDDKRFGSQMLKPMTMKLLNDYFAAV
ncbi:penicillin-binding transpeptidase domain-containing protein [Candidatus Berkiella aquae]|nr:penicillin-binding transpeptidase domain-containing protein [Candidatus Berkiella aquae]MCS5711881.1 penicillin binding protein transpeptidase domain-containing protein [Candidatus Berkiella aquae]